MNYKRLKAIVGFNQPVSETDSEGDRDIGTIQYL